MRSAATLAVTRWEDVAVVEHSAPALRVPPTRDVALIVIGLAGVSLSGPLMAATAAPALAIAFWRNTLGAAVSGGLVAARERSGLRSLTARQWRTATLAGLFLALHFGTWVPSLTMTSVATATALVSTQPVFVALIQRARGVTMPRTAWVGIVVSVVAAGLITGADVSLSARAVAGDLLAVLGGLFAAGYVVVGAQARQTISAPVYTTVCYSVCAVALLCSCGLGRQRLVGFPADAWLKIAAVTVVAQLLGHTLFNVVLRTTGATVISLALLWETPGAAFVAFVWLHQHPPATAWPGLALLLVALAVVVSARQSDPVEATD